VEYRSILAGLIGVISLIFWSLEYFKILKKPQLTAPVGAQKISFLSSKYMLGAVGIIAWLFISYALMGPRKPLKYSPSNIEVNDIYMVVDVSRSMLATDLEPNRLEVAKEQLRKFAALRPTDRLGVIIFSEKVFTMLPLTTDPSLIDKVLSDIKIGFLGSGTNIGDALALAVARGQASETKNKVIILLTDGVSNVGNMPPLEAAKIAKEYNMKVYTIGLGANMDAKIPMGSSSGRSQYRKIPGGSIDVKTLQEISDLTGGKMYLAGSENSLQEILREIQSLEKTKIKSNKQVVYKELFYQYLLVGICLLVFVEFFRIFVNKEVA
jgi:Ca-activated chloride channel family protein